MEQSPRSVSSPLVSWNAPPKSAREVRLSLGMGREGEGEGGGGRRGRRRTFLLPPRALLASPSWRGPSCMERTPRRTHLVRPERSHAVSDGNVTLSPLRLFSRVFLANSHLKGNVPLSTLDDCTPKGPSPRCHRSDSRSFSLKPDAQSVGVLQNSPHQSSICGQEGWNLRLEGST